jgi:hypothetical protein
MRKIEVIEKKGGRRVWVVSGHRVLDASVNVMFCKDQS